MNDLAVQQWGYLDGELAQHSAWPPSSWPVAASLVSPGDVGWKLLSGVSWTRSGTASAGEWISPSAPRTPDLPQPRSRRQGSGRDRAGGSRAAAAGRLLLRAVRTVEPRDQPGCEAASESSAAIGVHLGPVQPRGGPADVRHCPPGRCRGVLLHASDRPDRVRRAGDAQRYIDDVRARLADATAGRTSERIAFDPQGPAGASTCNRVKGHRPRARRQTPKPRVLAQDLCALIKRQRC